jgi:hypothetical protein
MFRSNEVPWIQFSRSKARPRAERSRVEDPGEGWLRNSCAPLMRGIGSTEPPFFFLKFAKRLKIVIIFYNK